MDGQTDKFKTIHTTNTVINAGRKNAARRRISGNCDICFFPPHKAAFCDLPSSFPGVSEKESIPRIESSFPILAKRVYESGHVQKPHLEASEDMAVTLLQALRPKRLISIEEHDLDSIYMHALTPIQPLHASEMRETIFQSWSND